MRDRNRRGKVKGGGLSRVFPLFFGPLLEPLLAVPKGIVVHMPLLHENTQAHTATIKLQGQAGECGEE